MIPVARLFQPEGHSQSRVQLELLVKAQVTDVSRQQSFRKADQFVAMQAAFVLQSFLHSDPHLRTQAVMSRTPDSK